MAPLRAYRVSADTRSNSIGDSSTTTVTTPIASLSTRVAPPMPISPGGRHLGRPLTRTDCRNSRPGAISLSAYVADRDGVGGMSCRSDSSCPARLTTQEERADRRDLGPGSGRSSAGAASSADDRSRVRGRSEVLTPNSTSRAARRFTRRDEPVVGVDPARRCDQVLHATMPPVSIQCPNLDRSKASSSGVSTRPTQLNTISAPIRRRVGPGSAASCTTIGSTPVSPSSERSPPPPPRRAP
jgi:hypothetical protein